MLSQIEREQANPTLAVTMRIAQAFAMPLGDLLEMPDATSAVTVIRGDDCDPLNEIRTALFSQLREAEP